jgi:hypothetical protein
LNYELHFGEAKPEKLIPTSELNLALKEFYRTPMARGSPSLEKSVQRFTREYEEQSRSRQYS